jgi:hypothetical protein
MMDIRMEIRIRYGKHNIRLIHIWKYFEDCEQVDVRGAMC